MCPSADLWSLPKDSTPLIRSPRCPARPPERFAADGFHPNAEACAEWAAWLAAQAVHGELGR